MNITFKEIIDNNIFYCNYLLNSTENTFVLFQYGPYLVKNNTGYFICNFDGIKNPILKFITLAAGIIDVYKVYKKNLTFKLAKEAINNLSCLSENLIPIMNDKIHLLANKSIESIRKYQKESKSLESALLSSAPITPYNFVITNPELTNLNKSSDLLIQNRNNKLLEEKIINYLINYVDIILLENDEFLDINDFMKSFTILMDNSTDKNVCVYFLLIYLRYVINKEDYNKTINYLEKLYNSYLDIRNKEKVNVTEILDQITHFIKIED